MPVASQAESALAWELDQPALCAQTMLHEKVVATDAAFLLRPE